MLRKVNTLSILLLSILMLSFTKTEKTKDTDEGFRKIQLNNSRVQNAFDESIDSINNWLLAKNISIINYEILIRAFKKEEQLEVWVKNKEVDTFSLLKTYKICLTSGFLGPKRKQGDKQIPEGVYYINEFNPNSNYHLSMGLNYPNKADSILGFWGNWGGDIYIHGGCESIGCLPITTRKIKGLYVLAMQARYFGQTRIPVQIFPCKLTKGNYKTITQAYNNPQLSKFWGSLRSLYDYFERTHTIPIMKIDIDGKYYFFANK